MATLTVREWADRWNAQFVHLLPRNNDQLQTSIEDMVVTESEVHAAREHGRDREPKFIEDRRNFLYYQALDLYEKEILLPRIKITSAESEAYYKEHPTEFSRPIRARGKLFRFSDDASAIEWLHSKDRASLGTGEDVIVSAQSPLTGAENATGLILRMDVGKTFGPVHTPLGPIVFFKQYTETELLPYKEAVDSVQATLSRPKMEKLEIGLAREWASRYAIQDNINPEKLGIRGSIQKPWAPLAVD
jgi:hypothetical protein